MEVSLNTFFENGMETARTIVGAIVIFVGVFITGASTIDLIISGEYTTWVAHVLFGLKKNAIPAFILQIPASIVGIIIARIGYKIAHHWD